MVFKLRCVRRVADKQVAKGLPMSGRIDYSEPILWREEQELDGIGNGTSTPRRGGNLTLAMVYQTQRVERYLQAKAPIAKSVSLVELTTRDHSRRRE